jgi:hypothetical protein
VKEHHRGAEEHRGLSILDPQFFTYLFKKTVDRKLRVEDERRDDAGLSDPAAPGNKHPLPRSVRLV